MSFDRVVLLASFTLLSLPTIGGGIFSQLLMLAPFWLVICRYQLLAPILSPESIRHWQGGIRVIQMNALPYGILALFWLLLLIALVRAFVGGLLTAWELLEHTAVLTTVLLFAVTIWAFAFRGVERGVLVKDLFWALGIYLTLAVLLKFVGAPVPELLYAQSGSTARMLSWVGVTAQRTRLPLGAGLNGAGLLGGAALQAGLVLFVRDRGSSPSRALSLWLAGIGTLVMLLTDSRAPMFMALVCAVVAAVSMTRALAMLRWSALAAPLLPIGLLLTVGLLANTSFASAASRGTTDLTTGNGRFFIWGSAIQKLWPLEFGHVVGYGFRGHVASGAVINYQDLFGRVFNPEWLTAHNGVLQYALDTGYLGAAVMLTLFFLAMGRATRDRSGDGVMVSARVVAGALFYLLLTGSTEASPTFYNRGAFVLFLFCVVAAISPRAERQLTPAVD